MTTYLICHGAEVVCVRDTRGEANVAAAEHAGRRRVQALTIKTRTGTHWRWTSRAWWSAWEALHR